MIPPSVQQRDRWAFKCALLSPSFRPQNSPRFLPCTSLFASCSKRTQMSFNSMYLDLPTWHLRSLPMMKDIDLRTFWGDSLLRIVIYEKVCNPSESRHLTKENTYFFSIETEFLGVPDKGGRTVKVDDQDTLPWDKTKKRAISRVDSTFFAPVAANDDVLDAESSTANLSERPVSEATEYDEEEEEEESDSDETAFFDAEESQAALLLEDVGLDADADTYGLDTPLTPERPAAKEPPSAADAAAAKSLSPADRFCPGWVEMCAERGKYRKVYAFVVGGGSRTIFRTSSDFTGSFSTAEEAKRVVERTCSPRLSSSEKLRRVMGLTVAKAREPSSKLYRRYRAFIQKQSALDARFLRRPAPSQLNVKVKGETIISGFAARALSEHHWKEEWVVLSDRYVSFFHPSYKRPSFRVSLGGIVGVSKLPLAECPNFPGCHVLSIETTGRRIYLMFFSETESNNWLDGLSQYVTADAQPKPKETNILFDPLSSSFASLTGSSLHDEFLALNNDPTEEFLHKTSMFSCKDRRILNCRKFSFTGIDGTQGVDPCHVVETALREALDPIEDNEVSNLCKFLDSTSDLKTVNVSELTGAERMAFFLNLYHVMATHAYLVLGVPDSSFKWVSYFNMISYQCSDEIFSLSELEHCIIREQTSSPSQFVAKFILPKSRYNFAVHSLVDWRVNFCLNCGSLSNPRSVPIFRADSLLSQMNESTRLYFKETVKVSVDSRKGVVSVTLPRICQWYATDFGRGRSTDVVRQIMKYLSQREQDILSRALAPDGRHFKAGALSITFSSFDYTCRLLTLRGDGVLDEK
uniref:PH domain-containing protein n=1 Tax=Odontella aurita TaxID=265563 RepID=A0A6U6J9H7_9STRA|mmetsp:Transcript_54680/g.163397  ORF Transcript_54680/g.163397 Transcript_54680/m.163397 type:complete len:808 (+) Transcript_54680:902-3325(+)